jgi:uncharacterized membrane protein
MTRNEFMTALRRRLSHLPPDEQDAALKYYEEYFDEAASEEEAAQQLGSPDAIADRILSDYAPPAQVPPKKEHSAWYWTGIVVLFVFASPFLLALGAAALAIGLGLAACALGAIVLVVTPFLALSISLICCFFALLWAGAIALPTFMPGGLLLLGVALLCGGLGLLNGVLTGYLCYWIGLLFKKIFSSRKQKKEAK